MLHNFGERYLSVLYNGVPNCPVNYTECGVCPDNDRYVSKIIFTGVVREQLPYNMSLHLRLPF